MSRAPTNPAVGSTFGSRVVTTSATRIQTTPAAAKKPRLVRRSRASMRRAVYEPPRGAVVGDRSGNRRAVQRADRRQQVLAGHRLQEDRVDDRLVGPRDLGAGRVAG